MAFLDQARSAIKKFDPTYDVDTTDRLKYVYTPWLLCGTAFLIFAKEYVGQPLQCWVPNQFSKGWEDYAESYCLIEGTYYVHSNQSNLPSVKHRGETQIMYYQWVPFILVIQALIVYAPRFYWKMVQKVKDLNISLVTMPTRNHAKKQLGFGMKCDVTPQRAREVWHWGYRLTLYLLSTKMLSILLLAIQIIGLEWFISGRPFSFFGWSVLNDVIHGRQWQESGAFPRVTFCDIEVREMGQVHRWSLQCVLMVNMFNEKIFLFVWWWLCLLLLISILNLIKWIIRINIRSQNSFLESVINCIDPSPSPRSIDRFRSSRLKADGVTLLRLIRENATIYQASAFIEPMWKEFNDKRQ